MGTEEETFTYEDAKRVNPNMTPELWAQLEAGMAESDRQDACELAFSTFKTNRGFGGINFKDRYGTECNIQDSSLATAAAIWIGCANDDVTYMTHVTGCRNTFSEYTYVSYC